MFYAYLAFSLEGRITKVLFESEHRREVLNSSQVEETFGNSEKLLTV